MFLTKATVGPFRSINEQQTVNIDKAVTVFVGMNEAGKTVFLQALEKANDAIGIAKYNPVDDYPRKDLSSYLKIHKSEPAEVTQLTFRLTDNEIKDLREVFGSAIGDGFELELTYKYDGTKVVALTVSETVELDTIRSRTDLSSDAKASLKGVASLRKIPDALKAVSLTEADNAFLTELATRIGKTKWENVVQFEVWSRISEMVPRFLYFGEYDLLPSKMNLADLAQRVELAKADPRKLEARHRGVLALLRMADISIADFSAPGGYEALKAKIEGVSIKLTDQVLEFWKQNEDLEVEVDIKTDPEDEAPFNSGVNLYLRIKNRRHRGVSTPFGQRSRGFIWFFSFLVWFDSVQHQIKGSAKTESRGLILLLDEPGLALHALAQADFLRYIDDLSKRHQVIYTTHSPFMVHSDRLHQARIVEDQPKIGTVISDNVTGSDPRTIFPLQAALGWTIAQNLFISKNNLLVEGPSELVYLKAVSAILDSSGKKGLREDITIVPVGGLDKVVTFVALLGASKLNLVVLHDYRGVPEQKLLDLVKQKMISAKAVLNASQFRDPKSLGVAGAATDIEDLLSPAVYLDYFNRTFSAGLSGKKILEGDLPDGERIVVRLENYLKNNNIPLRPSGGFNHFSVASCFASNPPGSLDADTVKRFIALFSRVNDLL